MVFSKDFVLCSSTHESPLPADGSLMVVIPCAIHNLKTYSAGVPCSFPPIWPCISIRPGIAYIPSQLISLPPSFKAGLRAALMGKLGLPTF